jgi:hypothetical protein
MKPVAAVAVGAACALVAYTQWDAFAVKVDLLLALAGF